jgi:hypothetical protein
MRKLPLLSLLVSLFALRSFAAETYKDVSVVDVNCSKKRVGRNHFPRCFDSPRILAGGANSEQENHTETDKPESLHPSFDGIIRKSAPDVQPGQTKFPP